ncbi:recombination associated protein RdgC [Kushneria sinocarnis]|uniref:Recombination-associated protein RdgC n=1 Tax=Kushneria sinocarnis TaxID=595502 RepID=A0A420WVA4_9GAMM|nr:recombination-associated protein RdgC [Kushneria sinocarnis]RKR02475.1 recombination associated protein RdgC [Kushneria sinocarnis]
MWFKHLHLYRLHEDSTWSFDALQDALAAHAFAPVTSHQARAHGWTTPAGRQSEQLLHEVSGHRLLTLMRQERLLPPAVIRETLEERVAEQEAAQGYPPGRREKQALKERIIEELLPQAFTRSSRTDLWWDTRRGLIGINASSARRAEQTLDALRQSLGSLKVAPLAVATPPGRTMTGWLSDPAARPEGLLLGDQIELRSRADDDGVLRARSIDPDGEEIRTALEVGRQVSRLSLALEGQLSLTLQEDLALKSLRFDDAVIDEANDSSDSDNPVMSMETEFVLMAQVLSNAVEQLIRWLGGEAEAVPATP